MLNPIAWKLELFASLRPEDKAVLSRLFGARVRRFGSREDIIREGDRPRSLYWFLSGWACRYKQLEDGRRQIVAFCLPGDFCDLNIFTLQEMDHSIATISAAAIAETSRDAFEEILISHPRVMQALWWESLVNAAIQREWTTSLGKRTAIERIAHLICELFLRLKSIGLATHSACDWPLTQVELADATGMTAVHTSRTLQELRNLGLITLNDRSLTVVDLDGLMQLAMFDPNYLHLPQQEFYSQSGAGPMELRKGRGAGEMGKLGGQSTPLAVPQILGLDRKG